ncbi:hypothetical protein CC2G_007579 [Coprinopsis cinerea AmutBmut pab1-1]|nr:hypothetical protein CC2G_015225 [Coprinopsis cinerea AmutBmut pab1-1]KAG2018129.1 hypothetical protein CC2G_007579 [Coprinopsis cinerea AmutBmut pab1-1]
MDDITKTSKDATYPRPFERSPSPFMDLEHSPALDAQPLPQIHVPDLPLMDAHLEDYRLCLDVERVISLLLRLKLWEQDRQRLQEIDNQLNALRGSADCREIDAALLKLKHQNSVNMEGATELVASLSIIASARAGLGNRMPAIISRMWDSEGDASVMGRHCEFRQPVRTG